MQTITQCVKVCPDCGTEKPLASFRHKLCKLCFGKRYYKYPITGSKVDRISQTQGKPFPEILAEMRIDRNMKLDEIFQELGISKRTYLRYFPKEYIGYKRIETEDDIRQRRYWAKYARTIRLKKLIRKVKSKGDGYNWRKDMNRFFKRSRDERR